MKKVLFVCLGNICRSPTADAVFTKRVSKLIPNIIVDSAGTANWHIGNPPDARASATAEEQGYDMSGLYARAVIRDDFHDFDYILAMDRQNLSDLETLRDGQGTKPQLFMDFAPAIAMREIPDPYYGGEDGFVKVIKMIEQASDGLIDKILA
ncbi:MAG: low molecular weight phosphotyrosine protein phosphatase [Robiginitomaculum sp.]|nr:low molecular weight phosphotyrosine protein phosphatase [Robiginitomaculum sp.]